MTLGLYDQGNPIEDWSPLKNMQSLKHLDVRGCGAIDIQVIAACPNLQNIEVDNGNFKAHAIAGSGLEHLMRWH